MCAVPPSTTSTLGFKRAERTTRMYGGVETLDAWAVAMPAVVVRTVALHGFGARPMDGQPSTRDRNTPDEHHRGAIATD